MHLTKLHEDFGAPGLDDEDYGETGGIVPGKPKSYGSYVTISSYGALGQLTKMILRSQIPDPTGYREVQYLIKALKNNPKFYKQFYDWVYDAKTTGGLSGVGDHPGRAIGKHESENLYVLIDYLLKHSYDVEKMPE